MRTILVAMLFGGCALDTDSVEQDVTGWTPFTVVTTTYNSVDTGQWASVNTCVLSGVRGNLSLGSDAPNQDGHPSAILSGSAINNPDVFVQVYSGRVNGVNLGNPVIANVTCIPYRMSASNAWSSAPTLAPPARLADLAPNRRCFLHAVVGGNNVFTHTSDYARVRAYTTADALHATPGWYVEGTFITANVGASNVRAYCVDFPTIAAEWGGAFGGATYPVTSGTGVKMCGLTGIYGAFDINDRGDGAVLDAPPTQTGNWTMTVSPNKYAEADCIQ